MSVVNILLRRKNRLLVPVTNGGRTASRVIASFNTNIQSLGYTLSPRAIRALERTSEVTTVHLMETALQTLKLKKGVHAYSPMYPNFPKQVMEASECELYFNAFFHYFSFQVVDHTGNPDDIWLPQYDKVRRRHLDEKVKMEVIDLITEEEVHELATAIATSNTSISQSDKDDLRTFFNAGYLMMPKLVPNKENLAHLGSMFIDTNVDLAPHFKTTTDILRLATAMSAGDVSLSEDSKFRCFKRPERRALLMMLDNCAALEEDMLRWKERWLRLGEVLHPGDYAKRFQKTFRAFNALRNTKIRTIRTHVEAAVRGGETVKALTLLSTRPGDFARRLDHLLRTAGTKAIQRKIVSAFDKVAADVSTPVLLQVLNHFKNRSDARVVFPKGMVARATEIPAQTAGIPETIMEEIAEGIELVLTVRFSKLPKLGKVFIDPKLRDCLVPFSQRSASKSLRTLVRGSKLAFGHTKDTLRFFIWWKEPKGERTDIDLSASLLDKDFNHIKTLAYYDLKDGFGCHSGDITSAPNGASEFIDINLPMAMAQGGRYIVMSVNSFTENPFCDLPECNAGWMLREKPQSGEVYDPRTVMDKVDLSMDATYGIPMIIDIKERKIIWCDIALEGNGRYANNVFNNKGTMQLVGKALTQVSKPNLYDLLNLHARGRGKIVPTRSSADTVFSIEAGTPFELEKIASEFMSDVKAPKKKAAGN